MWLRPPARPNLALLDRVLSTPSRARVNTEEKYRPGGKTLEGVDPTMPIRRTFEENLVPCLSPEAALRSDVMREDRCYHEAVDIVLRKHEKVLVAIYRNYSMRNPIMPQKKAKFGIEEWLALLKESKVISEDLTRREAILAFVWSRMRVPDALTNRFTVETLT